jgi:hypothetical protein
VEGYSDALLDLRLNFWKVLAAGVVLGLVVGIVIGWFL